MLVPAATAGSSSGGCRKPNVSTPPNPPAHNGTAHKARQRGLHNTNNMNSLCHAPSVIIASAGAAPKPRRQTQLIGRAERSAGLRLVHTRCGGAVTCFGDEGSSCSYPSRPEKRRRAIDMQSFVVTLGITVATGAAFYNSMKACTWDAAHARWRNFHRNVHVHHELARKVAVRTAGALGAHPVHRSSFCGAGLHCTRADSHVECFLAVLQGDPTPCPGCSSEGERVPKSFGCCVSLDSRDCCRASASVFSFLCGTKSGVVVHSAGSTPCFACSGSGQSATINEMTEDERKSAVLFVWESSSSTVELVSFFQCGGVLRSPCQPFIAVERALGFTARPPMECRVCKGLGATTLAAVPLCKATRSELGPKFCQSCLCAKPHCEMITNARLQVQSCVSNVGDLDSSAGCDDERCR